MNLASEARLAIRYRILSEDCDETDPRELGV